MSKKWKIAIGAVIAAVVVAGVALTIWGAVTFRAWSMEHGEWGHEAKTQLQCPEPCQRIVEGEVRLVDDDGDGIPDRGVIEVPEDLQHGWGYGPHFGSGHGPRFGRGFGPHFGWGFGHFFFVGGLFRLAFLALLIGLAVAFFRHRPWVKEHSNREESV